LGMYHMMVHLRDAVKYNIYNIVMKRKVSRNYKTCIVATNKGERNNKCPIRRDDRMVILTDERKQVWTRSYVLTRNR